MKENNINVTLLKNEIKKLSEEIKESKRKMRDPTLNKSVEHLWDDYKYDHKTHIWRSDDPQKDKLRNEYWEACLDCEEIAKRITKLCTLRALLRGKIHLSPNTTNIDLDKESLWLWVIAEAKEFAIQT